MSTIPKAKPEHYKRIRNIYTGMTSRCTDPSHKQYPSYGGRGINVCKEWAESIMNFYHWAISNGYEASLTIDRENNDGNYEPSNCRWVTQKVQQNNRRDNHIIEIDGVKRTMSQWSDISGIKQVTIKARINYYGWPDKKAVFQKTQKRTYV